MDRRSFLRSSLGVAGTTALGASFWRIVSAGAGDGGNGPYGPLGPPDDNGIRLPAGFTSRVIAESELPVESTGYVWHIFPDGGASFAAPDGGWVYVSNSEVPVLGGASAVRFDSDGNIADAYGILTGTSQNCAGGPTPWGTWLSCEEHDNGLAWECDPFGERADLPVSRPALGRFEHEAAAVDPVHGHVYLTEDKPDGLFYRFVASKLPRLDDGELQAAEVEPDSTVTWHPVPNPNPIGPAETPTRRQFGSDEVTVFNGGEGCWSDRGIVYFTTKGDNKVWAYDTASAVIEVIYQAPTTGAVLRGVDNVTVDRVGDVLVAEDGDDMQIVLLTDDGGVFPILQVVDHKDSEVTGPAFDPSGTRLYFSSQRGRRSGPGPGITYEVHGPFRSTRR